MSPKTSSVDSGLELLIGEYGELDEWFTLRVPVDEETVGSLVALTSALYTLLFFSDTRWRIEDIRATWLQLAESNDPARALPDIDPAHDLLGAEVTGGHLVLKLAIVPIETIAHVEALYRALQELAIHAHVDFAPHDMAQAFDSAMSCILPADMDIPW